jgi:hypothetical protein
MFKELNFSILWTVFALNTIVGSKFSSVHLHSDYVLSALAEVFDGKCIFTV